MVSIVLLIHYNPNYYNPNCQRAFRCAKVENNASQVRQFPLNQSRPGAFLPPIVQPFNLFPDVLLVERIYLVFARTDQIPFPFRHLKCCLILAPVTFQTFL